MNTLENMWYEGLPTNPHGTSTSQQCRYLCDLLRRNEQELIPLLPEKAKAVYEKMKDNLSELGQVSECEIFTQGFRLGARIMLDVLDDSDAETQ